MLKLSWIEVLEPSPFDGGCRCAASPMMKTRPDCMCVAYMLLTVQVDTEVISGSRTGRQPDRAPPWWQRRCRQPVRAVDVIAPDDQPFVPGPDHPHKTHADTADIGAGLHHPVEHRGAVGDIFAQIRLEDDVHRAADAHLSFERQLFQLGHLGIAAISAEQVFRPDGDLLAGEAVAGRWWSRRRHPVHGADTPSTSAPGCRASRRS
jgi:hypothetical protein